MFRRSHLMNLRAREKDKKKKKKKARVTVSEASGNVSILYSLHINVQKVTKNILHMILFM